MSKAKTASKNNPSTRQSQKDFLLNGKKVKPVKLVLGTTTMFGAEYESGDIVTSKEGKPIAWKSVSGMCTRG